MPHAIWKGSISFGLVNIPVGLYSAEKKDELDFVLLDKKDLAPVGYRRYNKKSGKEVAWQEVVKGYEYEEGNYVVLGPGDFKNANVQATQTVEIIGFVDSADIPAVFYAKPYYLEPAKKSKKSYALLREALKRSGKVGVASVVIHTRQYMAALLPMGKMLVLNLLRFRNELKGIEDFDLPGENPEELGIQPKEMEMAEKLVQGMLDRWEPEKYTDSYRSDLLALIRRKIEEGETRAAEAPAAPEAPQEGAEVIDLMSLLKKSLEASAAAKKEKRQAA